MRHSSPTTGRLTDSPPAAHMPPPARYFHATLRAGLRSALTSYPHARHRNVDCARPAALTHMPATGYSAGLCAADRWHDNGDARRFGLMLRPRNRAWLHVWWPPLATAALACLVTIFAARTWSQSFRNRRRLPDSISGAGGPTAGDRVGVCERAGNTAVQSPSTISSRGTAPRMSRPGG